MWALYTATNRHLDGFNVTVAQYIEVDIVINSERTASLALLPLTIPEPLVEPNLRYLPSSRKRAMTGLEAAEEEGAEKRREQRVPCYRRASEEYSK
jgi:hypothetical protein